MLILKRYYTQKKASLELYPLRERMRILELGDSPEKLIWKPDAHKLPWSTHFSARDLVNWTGRRINPVEPTQDTALSGKLMSVSNDDFAA